MLQLKEMKLFKMIEERMSWLSERQRVVANNIANADTPNYRPKDVKELDFKDMLQPHAPKPTMVVTNARHMLPPHQPQEFGTERDRDPYEISPTGNAVVLEEQLMKVAETQANHRLASNLYAKHLAMLREALGRGG